MTDDEYSAARARAGIREWIARRGEGLLRAGPRVIVTAMTAAALVPLALPLLAGDPSAASTALAALLGNIGGEHITRVMTDVANQLRAEGRAAADPDTRELVQDRLFELLESGLEGEDAAQLREEIARYLREVRGVGTALDAAFRSDVDGLYMRIGDAIHLLAIRQAEFRTLHDDVMAGLEEIQLGLAQFEQQQRRHGAKIEQISIQIAMLHRQFAISHPVPRALPAGADEGDAGALLPPETAQLESTRLEPARSQLLPAQRSTGPNSHAAATESEPCPYPGLAAFGETDARWFFGRERLTAELVTQLRQRLQGPSTLMVVGASGAGKSSVLHAGLLPGVDAGALAVPGSTQWPREVMKPGPHPLEELGLRIAARAGLLGPDVIDRLEKDPGSCRALVRQCLFAELAARARGGDTAWPGPSARGPAAGSDAAPAPRLVLVIDQFEEVFTQCEGEERSRFIDAICAAADGTVEDPAPALVVLGLRAGFVEHCTAHPGLAPALREQFIVGPMDMDELHAAIEGPAQITGLTVEPRLAEAMLRDLEAVLAPRGNAATYDPGRLPLLAHALRETWERRVDGRLTLHAYKEAGGIKQAIAKKADEVYGSFDANSQRVVRLLLESMVSVRTDAENTRHRMTRDELLARVPAQDAETARRVLDRLERERLVTSDEDSVQIAHEALLQYWPTLGKWLKDHRTWLNAWQRLTERAREWDEGSRHPELLLHRAQLSALHEELDGERRSGLGPLEAVYVDASEQRLGQDKRKRRILAAALAVVLMAVFGLGVSAYAGNSAADQEQAIALSRQLAGEADAQRGADPEVSMLLSLEAYRVAPTDAAVNSLLSSQSSYFNTRLNSDVGAVNAVAYGVDSADRGHARLLAAAGENNAVELWDTDHLRPVATLSGRAPFYAVAFSSDGRLLAGSEQNGDTIVWQVGDRAARPVVLNTGTDAVDAVAFSGDGRLLATAGYDGSVQLWQVSPLKHVATLAMGNGTVSAVAFALDGTQLAAACTDGKVRVWKTADLADGPQSLNGHTGLVRAVAYSNDGSLLASGGDDGTVRLWDAREGKLLGVLTGSTGPVRSVAFSPDRSQLASAGEDDAVRLWDTTTRLQIGALTGPTNAVAGVAFSPDGHTVAGADTDATVGLWNVAAPQQAGNNSVAAVAVPPGGDGPAATSGAGGTTYLWRPPQRSAAGALGANSATATVTAGTAGDVTGVAFSSDGKTIAVPASAPDHGVVLWDVANNKQIRLLRTSNDNDDAAQVDTVAFRPLGSGWDVVAAGGTNDAIYLWGRGQLSDDPPPNTALSGPITAVAFSPDGRMLAAGSQDGTILLLQVKVRGVKVSDSVIEQLSGSSGAIRSVAFSPDGHTLASGSADGTVRLWNVSPHGDQTPLITLYGQSQAVVGVAFSGDGRTLASSAADHTIRVWDVHDPHAPTAKATLVGPANPTQVAFEPGHDTVIGAAADGTALFWDIDADQVAIRLCASNLTAAAAVLTPQLTANGFPPLCPGKT